MLLETGGADVQFATRLVSGVDPAAVDKPVERLILDGQQRLTSLFQALESGQVVQTQDTRKQRLERWFYIAIEEALDTDGDREAAIKAVPGDKVQRDNFGKDVVLDLSTTELEITQTELEITQEHFPLFIIFDGAAVDAWTY
jgi:hypothetical protein